MIMENRQHRLGIIRVRRKHINPNILNIKKYLGKMVFICIQQQLSNISGSICQKIKQHFSQIEKKGCLQKSVSLLMFLTASQTIWANNQNQVFITLL